MRSTLDNRLRASAATPSRADAGARSWLPMQPHLLVAVDPIRWSRQARADQRWQPGSGTASRNS
jgi:hypothetical protein